MAKKHKTKPKPCRKPHLPRSGRNLINGWIDIDIDSPPEGEHVLVTNNENARSRDGKMCHVWIAVPFGDNEGNWLAREIGGHNGTVYGITAWRTIPLATRKRK